MIEDEKKFDNKNYIEKHNKDVALSREMEQQKPEKTFMGYFEEDYQKVRKRIKLIKHTKCVFKLATIIACLISATLFLSALIDKNTARSEFKKTQEYNNIVKENSAEIYQKFENEEISSHEYIKETKSLASKKFVDNHIKNSTENLHLKNQYQNHNIKNIAGACSIVGGVGLAASQIFLNKKMEKEEKEEEYYKQFFL